MTFDVYEVVKMLKSYVRALGGSSPAFFATCLSAPFEVDATPQPVEPTLVGSPAQYMKFSLLRPPTITSTTPHAHPHSPLHIIGVQVFGQRAVETSAKSQKPKAKSSNNHPRADYTDQIKEDINPILLILTLLVCAFRRQTF